MGLFKKKNKDKKPEAPQKLPELPPLPEFKEKDKTERSIHQLPSFPNDSLGDRFSQNTIKEAITGKKEDDVGGFADEVAEEERQVMQSLPEMKSREIFPHIGAIRETKTEPIFIRIDKFEEALSNFEKAKKEIQEIERLLRNTKRIKEEEEKELQSWENQVQSAKNQIEKIDKDIFSKVE